MIVTLSCAARRSAAELGIPEPVVKQARRSCFREHQEPAFLVAYAEVDGKTLRMRCCHHDPGQIVSLGEA